jgi:photosystem II stability/assembly factor-like uncharacterized protein
MLPSAPSTRSTRPTSRRGSRRALVAAAATVAALVLAGCSGPSGSAAPESAVTLEHVHGLGVDPADGQLYAGTHHGLIRISAGGELTRIADRVQDYMGFTVVGPRHYFASGHPGPGESGPSNLGLIESTDGGQTWNTLSLAGEADFHALDAGEGVIYGYTAGRLMTSQDGRSWENRGEMGLADLAVDPTQPQRLLVTTEGGPALSEDGGRSFRQLPDAPLMQLVDFSPDGADAVGVAPDGAVYASSDAGRTWTLRGNAGGPPEALGVNGEDVYVALEGAIVASADSGATFTDLYRGD